MKRRSNFAPVRLMLIGLFSCVLFLATLPQTAMLSPHLLIANTPNHAHLKYQPATFPASAPGQSDQPHTMVASHYRLQGNLKSSISLNNKGLVPLEVTPTLFSLSGEHLDVPPVTVDATSFHVFDLAEWAAPGGLAFQQGSLQLFYRGKDLLLGAQLKMTDSNSSLIFDEQLTETGSMISSRLEGLWWLPSRSSQVSIAISNTTDSTVIASLSVDGIAPKQEEPKELVLGPHQTMLLDPAQDLSDKPAALLEAGGISISHSGEPGALIARAMIQDAAKGFSSVVQFSDPKKSKSASLHGAGLRWGEIAGEALIPVIVARNISPNTAVLQGRIPYTRSDGRLAVMPLRAINLRPGEVKAWEITEVRGLNRASVKSAGLEINYNTEPGSVIVSALSISKSGNHVFQVPMLDMAAQKSSTGVYPFYVYGSSSTVVHIKNTTGVEQSYIAHLNYESGQYMMGVKSIAPGETVTIDVRALRDNQVPGDDGSTIPQDITHGQVRWAVVPREEMSLLVLIGRAEQVDEAKAMTSTYACQSCCGDAPLDSSISPSPVELQVGESVQMRAFELITDCYGYTYWVEVAPVSWSSSDNSVATVSGGRVTPVEGGEATITASWGSFRSMATQCRPGSGFESEPIEPIPSCCRSIATSRSASAQVRVRPRIDRIDPPRAMIASGEIGVTITGRGFGNNKDRVGVTVGGTGISARVDQVTSGKILATFIIGDNAERGNHTVIIRVSGVSSNSVDFFVQIPTRLRRGDVSGLMDQQGGCGVTRTVEYTLLDQGGQPIIIEATLEEIFSNITINPPGIDPPEPTQPPMNAGQARDVVGYRVPNCPPPFTISLTQTFRVTIGQSSFDLSTTNSVSMGRDQSGAKFVDIIMTRP